MLSETDGTEVSSKAEKDVVSEDEAGGAAVDTGTSFLHPLRAAAVIAASKNADISFVVRLCKTTSFLMYRKLFRKENG